MERLKRIYGTPHELLHVLALALIGRRALEFASDHVIIPSDLTTRQYVFVAGLPAVVFVICFALGGVGLLNARTVNQAGIAAAVMIASAPAVAGTIGDMQLIVLKLTETNQRP